MNQITFKKLSTEGQKKYLNRCDIAYYDYDNPVIADELYDVLKNIYLNNIGKSEYVTVPGNVSNKFKKFQHPLPILSLSKINTEQQLREELKRLAPGVIEPKFDGITVVRYPDGIAVTRGNGKIGEVITKNASKITNFNNISKDIDYPIRMEAIMTISDFNKINQKRADSGQEIFKNPRNAVAGMLRNKDSHKVDGVSYFAYNIVNNSELTETDQLELLKKDGAVVTPYYEFNESNIEETIERILNFDRSILDYEIDGLVIKSNIKNASSVFGFTEHHPKSACAFKFTSSGEWTELLDVVWQLGRFSVTPVGIIKPINIGGTTIERVTLHNIKYMNELKLSKGCKVFVIRSNDVIPAVVEAKNYNALLAFKLPTECPECGKPLFQINNSYFCLNADCRGKIVNSICHLAQRDALNIEGLSEQTAKKMADTGIKHAFEILNFTQEDIENLQGFSYKSSNNLWSSIQKAKTTDLNRFLYAAGIMTVGKSVSRDIASKLGLYESVVEDIKNDCTIIRSINGIGDITINALMSNIGTIENLHNYVTPLPYNINNNKTNDIQTFVITGTLSKPRSYYEKLIQDAGHKISNSVTKKTSYLVCNEHDSLSAKTKKATELNIPIINESFLLQKLQ